jgi:hypothetical protein
VLRRWAEEKYRLPWTHKSIQDLTPLELWTRVYEDYYHENKIEIHRGEDGEIKLETDDAMVNKWEEELAMGLDPDITEGLTEDQIRRFYGRPKKKEETGDEEIKEDFNGWNDDFSNYLTNK